MRSGRWEMKFVDGSGSRNRIEWKMLDDYLPSCLGDRIGWGRVYKRQVNCKTNLFLHFLLLILQYLPFHFSRYTKQSLDCICPALKLLSL